MEMKTLNAAIKKVGKASATLKADIQFVLNGVAYHAQLHRNVEPANRLLAAVGNEANRKAIGHWLSTYAPIYFKNEVACLSDKRQKEFDGTIAEFMACAEDAPKWYEFASEGNQAENVWDANKELRAIAAYLEKRAKKFAAFDGADQILDVLNVSAIKLAALANESEFTTVE